MVLYSLIQVSFAFHIYSLYSLMFVVLCFLMGGGGKEEEEKRTLEV